MSIALDEEAVDANIEPVAMGKSVPLAKLLVEEVIVNELLPLIEGVIAAVEDAVCVGDLGVDELELCAGAM